MARKSAAALSITPPAQIGPIGVPDGLSPAEAALWREVVDSKPADWFGDDSAPVLKEYVRAAVMCDRLAEEIETALAGDAKGLTKLLEARDRESRRTANLATKLRLTQQSRYTPQAAATADRKAAGKRPWSA